MGELQQQITSAIGGFFSSGAVQLGVKLVAIYFVALWLASAYWVYRDMHVRSEQPVLPYVAAGLVILFTPLFFVLALMVYWIVRPPERVVQRRERELSEALLLSEIGEIEQCAGCHRIVDPEWTLCPSCRTELREHCPRCAKLVEFDWMSCAWCGLDLGEARRPAVAEREPVPVMDEAAVGQNRWSPAPRPIAMATESGARLSRPRR